MLKKYVPKTDNAGLYMYSRVGNRPPGQLDSEKKPGSKFKNVSFFHISGKKEFFYETIEILKREMYSSFC